MRAMYFNKNQQWNDIFRIENDILVFDLTLKFLMKLDSG